MLAGIGRGQLSVLHERVDVRREINRIYREELAGIDGLEFMPEAAHGRSSCWLTCLTLDPTRLAADREDEALVPVVRQEQGRVRGVGRRVRDRVRVHHNPDELARVLVHPQVRMELLGERKGLGELGVEEVEALQDLQGFGDHVPCVPRLPRVRVWIPALLDDLKVEPGGRVPPVAPVVLQRAGDLQPERLAQGPDLPTG